MHKCFLVANWLRFALTFSQDTRRKGDAAGVSHPVSLVNMLTGLSLQLIAQFKHEGIDLLALPPFVGNDGLCDREHCLIQVRQVRSPQRLHRANRFIARYLAFPSTLR